MVKYVTKNCKKDSNGKEVNYSSNSFPVSLDILSKECEMLHSQFLGSSFNSMVAKFKGWLKPNNFQRFKSAFSATYPDANGSISATVLHSLLDAKLTMRTDSLWIKLNPNTPKDPKDMKCNKRMLRR